MNRGIAVLVSIAAVLAALGLARAYSDETVAIDVTATCAADGFCQPEMYVRRADTGQSASVRVQYAPATDPLRWTITARNAEYLVADASENYLERGCATFFSDCPDTTPGQWFQNQETYTVVLDTDVQMEFRLTSVPKPSSVEVDGALSNQWEYAPDSGRVWGLSAGVHTIVFHMGSGGGGLPADPLVVRTAVDPGVIALIVALVLVLAFLALPGRKRRKR